MRTPPSTDAFEALGRTYVPPPVPVAVLCLDGCADEYLDAALVRGRAPRIEEIARRGWRGLARSALPSFTNVNNCAIVSGAPPSVTGVSGNFFLDPETGEEVMMNSPEFLRCDTILAAAARAGRRVAMVTAKDKLRALLSRDMDGIAISAEKASEASLPGAGPGSVIELVGRDTPEIYSADASTWVLRAGVELARSGHADFLYLSLTDYVQHKHAPEDPEALDFIASLDALIGELLDLGVVVGATADHGMNAKNTPAGEPNVVWLESRLTSELGVDCRVICPITDPYVVHHGALGAAVTVHLDDPARAPEVARWIARLDGITEVYDREEASRRLELPADRIGDLYVLCGRDVVIGRRPELHDLSLLHGGLRSHGGRYEEMVPLLVSEPLSPRYESLARCDPRNFDVFDFTLNGPRRTDG